ncbi:hypothetical protein D3C85_1506290 [compost metagenome]
MARTGSVLTNMPTTFSNSSCIRPDVVLPMTRSSCPDSLEINRKYREKIPEARVILSFLTRPKTGWNKAFSKLKLVFPPLSDKSSIKGLDTGNLNCGNSFSKIRSQNSRCLTYSELSIKSYSHSA